MNWLSYAQRENIGFQYVLDALEPATPYGQARVRQLQPFSRQEKPELQRQLDNLQRVLQCNCQDVLTRLQRSFMSLRMIRSTAQKCLEASLNEIELFEIKRFLLQTYEMLPLWQQMQSALALQGIHLADTTQALDLLDPQKNRVTAFCIADTSSAELLAARLEKQELDQLLRLSPENEALLARRSAASAREEQEQMRIQALLSDGLRPHIPAILQNMDAIAELDLTLEKARLAARWGGTMPVLTDTGLVLEDMINPRLADLLQTRGQAFVPVSLELQTGATVITGANMGGKSVALKTLVLNVLLVHCGFFPFAKAAHIPMFDSIHMICEDLSSVERGLSSFGGEIVQFNHVLGQLKEGYSLLLLDEFARGTNPDEGAAIVQAVTEYLNRENAITVLATHYDRIAPLGRAHYQVVGLRDLDVDALAAKMNGLRDERGMALIETHMNYGLYRVEDDRDCPKDALNICRLLGMEPKIMEAVEKFSQNHTGIC